MATTVVLESVGFCQECGLYHLLGNGLCQDCWDRCTESANNYTAERELVDENRDRDILGMADSGVPHLIIAAKYGLQRETVKKIVQKMRLKDGAQ